MQVEDPPQSNLLPNPVDRIDHCGRAPVAGVDVGDPFHLVKNLIVDLAPAQVFQDVDQQGLGALRFVQKRLGGVLEAADLAQKPW